MTGESLDLPNTISGRIVACCTRCLINIVFSVVDPQPVGKDDTNMAETDNHNNDGTIYAALTHAPQNLCFYMLGQTLGLLPYLIVNSNALQSMTF